MSKPHSVTINGCSFARVIKNPWAQPSAMAIASTNRTASGHAQCHSDNAIASMTPVNAHIDPMDKSMPHR